MDLTADDWSDLCIPVTLPELRVTPTHMQIFMFSAVTWNRHHIHYSRDAAVKEGLPDVVVQRALLGNFFARLLTDWMGHDGLVTRLSWKVLGSALPGSDMHCNGAITDAQLDGDARLLSCDLQITDAAHRLISQASAVLRLPQACCRPSAPKPAESSTCEPWEAMA